MVIKMKPAYKLLSGLHRLSELKNAKDVDAEGNPVKPIETMGINCDKCNRPMIVRKGFRGPFLS